MNLNQHSLCINIPGVKVFEVAHYKDVRGTFLKPVENSYVNNGKQFGEIYIIHAHPGAVRGNHHHRESNEWFCVISGQGLLVLEQDGLRDEIILDGNNPKTVKIPAGVAHAIKGLGTELMTLIVYWDRAYCPHNNDTYSEKIII